MIAFAKMIDRMLVTTDSSTKVEAFVSYLSENSGSDKMVAIKLLFGLRPKRIITLGELRELAVLQTQYPEWLFEYSLEAAKDLCETITLIVPQGDTDTTSLSHQYESIIVLRNIGKQERNLTIENYWQKSDLLTRYIFNKLISGTFRATLSLPELSQAIALHTGLPISSIAHRLNKSTIINQSSLEEFCAPHKNDRLSIPFEFPDQLEWKENNDEQWKSIVKYEGLPVQIISREGAVFLYLKDYGLVNEYFTDAIFDLSTVKEDFVVIGQLMIAGDSLSDNELRWSSQSLTAHMNKKGVNKNCTKSIQIVCHDLLELGGSPLHHGYVERLMFLDQFFETHQLEIPTYLSLAEVNNYTSEEKTDQILILKRQNDQPDDSEYIKTHSSQSIKAVLLYAHRADGWSSSNYIAYTFAVRNRDDSLIPVTKTFDGLDSAEYQKINAFVRNNVVERFGPTYSVKPKIIAEICFDKVEVSKRRKSGIVLINPTINEVYWDDPIDSISNLRNVVDLL